MIRKIIAKITKFIKDEYGHSSLRILEQTQYELQSEVDNLEKLYNESKNNIIWNQLEIKKEDLFNVSVALSSKRKAIDRVKN